MIPFAIRHDVNDMSDLGKAGLNHALAVGY